MKMSARLPSLLRGAALAAALACTLTPAGAVYTFTDLGTRSVVLRVGSANTTVNNVTFTVTGADMNAGTPVTGVPGAGAPASSPAGGIEIQVTTKMPLSLVGSDTMTLTVDSSRGGLACVAGSGCGTTIIPFTAIGWRSLNKDATGQDIQDGAFNGTATQVLATYTVYTGFPWTGQSPTMTNVLVFQYDNAQLYPAGRYTGRVTYTATNV